MLGTLLDCPCLSSIPIFFLSSIELLTANFFSCTTPGYLACWDPLESAALSFSSVSPWVVSATVAHVFLVCFLCAMSFFDPFLRDSDSPGPDAVFDPAGPKSPNQLSSSFVSFSSDWGGKQGASFYQSATSEWNGSPSDQFDLKAFHLHRRDQASSGSAPHSGHTASNHENTGSSVPGVSGHSGEFDTQSLGRKGGSRGQQRSGVGVEGDAEEILTSTTTSSGNSGTEHHGDEEVRRCPGTGVVSGPSREALEQEAQREPFRFIDFEVGWNGRPWFPRRYSPARKQQPKKTTVLTRKAQKTTWRESVD